MRLRRQSSMSAYYATSPRFSQSGLPLSAIRLRFRLISHFSLQFCLSEVASRSIFHARLMPPPPPPPSASASLGKNSQPAFAQ